VTASDFTVQINIPKDVYDAHKDKEKSFNKYFIEEIEK
jgi:hypothetical protein